MVDEPVCLSLESMHPRVCSDDMNKGGHTKKRKCKAIHLAALEIGCISIYIHIDINLDLYLCIM